MPRTCTTNSWPFPPNTKALQLDEKWAFVARKERNREPEDIFSGDQWDHVALDADSRLVLSVVVGRRIPENAELLLADVKKRMGGRCPERITTDEYPAYEAAILNTFGVVAVPPRTGKPGRPAGPRVVLPEGLRYATVHKTRQNGRVVNVEPRAVFGAMPERVQTSYVERHNGTDRGRNARKARKTYRFSKEWTAHESVSAFVHYSYNFCWPVRTLRQKGAEGRWRQRTPAMAAGLTDRVWPLAEWLSLPAVQR
jgi:IS1 family transposase